MFKKIKENIEARKENKKGIKEINEKLDTILEIVDNINDITVINERALNRINCWKEKYNEEHKKNCVYEVQAEKIINEFENEVKDLNKKLKKFEKEKENEK